MNHENNSQEGFENSKTSSTPLLDQINYPADLKQFDLNQLRLIASVGEPLNAEAVTWGKKAFGKPIYDNWWQTETGGIMISNDLRS